MKDLTVSGFRNRLSDLLIEFETEYIYANREDNEKYPNRLTENQFMTQFLAFLADR